MPAHRLRAALGGGALMLALLGAAAPARAQLTVYDPSNFSQNLLTAARALQQVNAALQGLQNQAAMLVNQARNLASLPYSGLTRIETSITQTEQQLGQAQRIAYTVSAVNQAFSQTYPQAYPGATSQPQLLSDAQARWLNAVTAFEDALRVQAGVVQNLATTRAQVSALVARSQSAAGALQASQSANQLAALQTAQLADLTAVMAAIARAQSLAGARDLETLAQAGRQTANFLDYGAGYQPGAAQMFH